MSNVHGPTIAEVNARVEVIEATQYDAETAHAMEDALHRDVLRAIASQRSEDPVSLAAAALATRDISFPRWYA